MDRRWLRLGNRLLTIASMNRRSRRDPGNVDCMRPATLIASLPHMEIGLSLQDRLEARAILRHQKRLAYGLLIRWFAVARFASTG